MQYRAYQATYQIGVFISRSSVNGTRRAQTHASAPALTLALGWAAVADAFASRPFCAQSVRCDTSGSWRSCRSATSSSSSSRPTVSSSRTFSSCSPSSVRRPAVRAHGPAGRVALRRKPAAHAVWEGLLGGGTYVNAFYLLSQQVPIAYREFSLGVTSVADSCGIALSGATSIGLNDFFCRHLNVTC